MGVPALRGRSSLRCLSAIALLLCALIAVPLLAASASRAAVPPSVNSLRRLSPRPPAPARSPTAPASRPAHKSVPAPGARPRLAYTGLDVRLVALLGAALLGAGIVLGVGARHAHER